MSRFNCILLLLVAVTFLPGVISAAPALKGKINHISVESVDSPGFNPGSHAASTSTPDWCMIEADYSFDAEKNAWSDNVELRWTVAVSAGSNKLYLLTRNVNYRDIELSRRHYVSIFIPPVFFERYGSGRRLETSRISVYVELYVSGKRIASKERRGIGVPSGEWWAETSKMKRMDGRLLPRYMTPFSVVDTHYYDTEINDKK
jgi:hypothetical protein